MEQPPEYNSDRYKDLSTIARELLALDIKNPYKNNNFDNLELLDLAIVTDPKLAEFSVYYFYLGTALLNKSQYQESIYFLQRALEMNKNWGNITIADANYKIGETYEKLENFDLAIKFYERSSLLDSNYAKKLNLLKELVQSKKNTIELIELAAERLKTKDYQKARESYQKLVEIQPMNSDLWFDLGLSYYHLVEYLEAIIALSKSIDINKNWSDNSIADAWFLLGRCYYFMGQSDEAISKFNLTLNIEPDYIKARKAIKILTEASQRKQKATDLASSGFEFLLKNNNDRASADFEKAVELDPSISNYWLGLGIALINSQKYQSGMKAIENALCLNNQWGRIKIADAWYYRGFATEKMGNLDQAFISYSKARSLSQKTHRAAIAKYEELYLERISQGKKHNSIKDISTTLNKEIDEILTGKQSSECLEDIQLSSRRIDLLTGVISNLSQLENSRDLAGVIERGFFREQCERKCFWVDLALNLTPMMSPTGNVVNYLAKNAIFQSDLTRDSQSNELERYISQLEPELKKIDNLKDAIDSRWSKEVERLINYWQRLLWELSNWIERMTLDDTKQKLLKRFKNLSWQSDNMLFSAFETIKLKVARACQELER